MKQSQARGEPHFRRNLFEIENARNMSRDELISTFVPTTAFWRLLSAKNHIVLGARGSGKTALAKMLAHDHLSRMRNDSRAESAVLTRSFIGIYVPTSIEWVGGLKNKRWMSEADQEHFFQWRLNVAACLALLTTLRSCLDTYVPDIVERARMEKDLAVAIGQAWADASWRGDTLRALQAQVEDIEYKKQQQIAREYVTGLPTDPRDRVGTSFDADLFVPLRRAIALAGRALALPDTTAWLLCLDEAEFLQPLHHRILNSYMRSHSGNLFFKLTTTPYGHHTLDTNTGVPLSVGHDLEYVYIDQDPVMIAGNSGEEGKDFARQLFNGRARASGTRFRKLQLDRFLGPSPLLDPQTEGWSISSPNMALLRKYADQNTLDRAEHLLRENPKSFRDQIGRKMHGALLLRQAVTETIGRRELDIYCGFAMAVRCGDANPRRLIRIFNSFLLEARWTRNREGKRTGNAVLSRQKQTRILMSFSTSTLTRVQSEDVYGPQLYRLMQALGRAMQQAFYDQPLTTDQVSSITVTRDDSQYWELVERAVALGLLFPNVSSNNPDQMPFREGHFHFAYVLAPHFRLLPRRGKARRLTALIGRDVPPHEKQLRLEGL